MNADDTKKLIRELTKEFEIFLKIKNRAPRTIKEYLRMIPKMSEDLILAPTRENVFEFISKYNYWLARGMIYNWLEFREEYNIRIPRASIKRKSPPPTPLSSEELRILRDYLLLKNIKHALMFLVTYSCALRRDELCSIRLKDFYWRRWNENREKGCPLIIRGKGGKYRVVYVHHGIMVILCKWLRNRKIESKDSRIFNINPTTWFEALRDHSIKALGKPINPHLLRHTRATNFYALTKDIMFVKYVLGHADIKTTQKYIHPEDANYIAQQERMSSKQVHNASD